jgi:hypothetical protein
MVWKILAALVILPILVLWFMVVRQYDEILALVQNEVVTDAGDQRAWIGRLPIDGYGGSPARH